jgi:hypothetical protein
MRRGINADGSDSLRAKAVDYAVNTATRTYNLFIHNSSSGNFYCPHSSTWSFASVTEIRG